MNPVRDYWIECVDEEQSSQPYYYNTASGETAWKMPLAYKYFANAVKVHDLLDQEQHNPI
jgi:hypothetical protein